MSVQHTDPNPLLVLKKTFLLIENMATQPSIGIRKLASVSGIHHSSAQRILNSLASLGYVEQIESNKQYRLTMKLAQLGAQLLSHVTIQNEARLPMQELAEITEEAVNLAILDGHHVVYLQCIPSRHPVGVSTRPGQRLPAIHTAIGKAMLAHQPPDVIKQAVETTIQRGENSHDYSSYEWLQEQMKYVRERGYSLDLGEFHKTTCGVGAPIRQADGTVVAAIAVAGMIDRMEGRKGGLPTLGQLVVSVATRISAACGWTETRIEDGHAYGPARADA